MEQQNFRVKFSLGTKLILSLSALFLLVLGFLSYSAVKLVVDDKTAYTFQLQSLEAYSAGQDFGEKFRPALENLRLYLTSFDPRTALSASQRENLQNLAKNQNEAVLLMSYLVRSDGSVTLLTKNANAAQATKLRLDPERIGFEARDFQRFHSALSGEGYLIESYVRPGLPPLLVIAFADIGLRDFEKGMPIAFSFIDAKSLIPNSRWGETTIATPAGIVLASTNADLIAQDLGANPAFQGAVASKIAAGTREYDIAGTSYLGAFRKLPSGPIVMNQIEKRKAMAAAFTLGERLVMLALISLVAAVLFAVLFAGSITQPLKRLTMATAQVARGEFNVDANVKTKDEVGALAHSFGIMSRKIQNLIIEQVQKAHLQEELKVAAAVQESLIPQPEYRDDRVEIFGSYESASECGGDWWGFFRIRNKVCIMIADATGHGVPSALITASARSCFSVLAKLANENPGFPLQPGEMMSYANRVIFDAATTKIMMTFFIGVIDLEAGTLSYANAGHNPPWLFQKNETGFKLKSLVAKGNRLGEVEESGVFEVATLPIARGDILFLYTDGLMENKNQGGEQYGKKRARSVVEKSLSDGPRGVITALKAAYAEYNGTEKALDDDVTLASVRIHS